MGIKGGSLLYSFIIFCVCCPSLCLTEQIKSLWNSNLATNRQQRQTAFCPSNSQCVPISSCPILRDVLNSECVLSSRIGKLGCGFQGSGLVCCPLYTDTNSIAQDRRDNVNTKCGQSSVQGEGYQGIGAYPWVARIGFRNSVTGEIKFPCTGSIINNRIILTAAHCALAKATNFKLYVVRVGEYLTNSDIDCGEEFCGLPAKDIPISHVIVHPGYQKETYRHNIALLVLRQNVNYSVTAQPICLPETWLSTQNTGILVGWGKAAGQRGVLIFLGGCCFKLARVVAHIDSYISCGIKINIVFRPLQYQDNIEVLFKSSPLQQTIRVPIVGIQQCKIVYGGTLPISEEQLCAGGEAGKDACSGFGGAPLLTRSGDSYYQVGILSFGSDQCGTPGIPSVYVDVKKYTQWINENIPINYN